LKRAIQQEIENPLSKQILAGKFGPKDVVQVDVQNGQLAFSTACSAGQVKCRSGRGLTEKRRNMCSCSAAFLRRLWKGSAGHGLCCVHAFAKVVIHLK
jgi:hypothetical protein